MPHDANAQFDQTTLDAIEHSPIGAVPYTPAYRDALARLYAAHQAYPSADHKGGHVTARSLTHLGSFYAENLDALAAGQDELLESNESVFKRYVESLPAAVQSKAESVHATVAGRPALHRAKHGVVVHDPVHSLFLVPGAGPHAGIPGNYLYGFIAQGGKGASATGWSIHLHDSEDGAVLFHADDVKDAIAKMHEVIDSAPFTMQELEALGFHFT
jgi:hypothetical protein